ncbi:MAG TPA: DUF2993 domain-containing protein, partial [Actinomycetota bacterium]|nr:DUF2993 domain-containing protein [Actinomycetota bacterium]
MRRLVVSLVVIVVVLLVADFGLRFWAESWFASQVQQGAELREEPDLDLRGFPFMLVMARGRLPSASVEAEAFSSGGLKVQRLVLELHDVRFSPGRLVSRGSGTIRSDGGTGRATVTQEDLTAYANLRGYPGRIAFHDGRATVTTMQQPLGVEVEVRATGDLSINE